MLKRRNFSVDTSSPYGEVQVSTPAVGRQNSVFPARGRRNKASPAAPAASTLQNPLGTRSVDAEVSTYPSQAARQTLPADKRLRRSHIWGRETSDHYVEPTWVSIRLFEVEDFHRSQVLLDPCTGFGRIAEAARAAGYTVIAADVIDRGYPGCLVQSRHVAARLPVVEALRAAKEMEISFSDVTRFASAAPTSLGGAAPSRPSSNFSTSARISERTD